MNHTELRRLAEAATGGKWVAARRGGLHPSVYEGSGSVICSLGCASRRGPAQNAANARHIAAASPAAVLALLDERDELVGLLRTMASHHCAMDCESWTAGKCNCGHDAAQKWLEEHNG